MTSEHVRIIKDRPHVFINYERQGNIAPMYEGESNARIWLRLHNNSKWQIMFCSGAVPKEYGEAEITYELERYKGMGDVSGTRSSDICAYRLLKSGDSVLFSIPREHLTEGVALKIQFRYIWENDTDGSDNLLEPKHFVYFFSEDIPGNRKASRIQRD
jgi:hypothetical protein